MGLDMYLSARYYVGGWNHSSDDERSRYAALMKVLGLDGFKCEGAPSATVNINVAYWRKANAIHRWFVDNTADGVDECQPSRVTREQLTELRDLCRTVIGTRDPSPLPPQGGCFFGSTAVDEYYWQDIEETEKVLTQLLEDGRFAEDDFEYCASW